jgi:hypothetical protein
VAVEALRGVLWEALLDELRGPMFDRSLARQVADFADRLAYVCAMTLVATIAATIRTGSAAAAVEDAVVAIVDSAAAVSESDGPPAPLKRVVLIDEREEIPAAPGPVIASQAPGSSQAEQTLVRPLPWDMPPSEPRGPRQSSQTATRRFREDPAPAPADRSAPAPPQTVAGGSPARGVNPVSQVATAPEIEIKDERGEGTLAAWIGSIGRELERFEEDQLPFAVLLVELGDSERLRRAERPGGLLSLTSQVERVLDEGLQLLGRSSAAGRDRPVGSLTCERPGRYWLLAPDTDAISARRLAEWLVRAIRPLASRRWAPVEVTIGTAVCPDDGRDATTLAARADAELYAARAREPEIPGRRPIQKP